MRNSLIILFILLLNGAATAQCLYKVDYKIIERECIHCHKKSKMQKPLKITKTSGDWSDIENTESGRLYWKNLDWYQEDLRKCTSTSNRGERHVWNNTNETETKSSYNLSQGEMDKLVNSLDAPLNSDKGNLFKIIVMVQDAHK